MSDRITNILDQMEHTKTEERYATGQVCKVFHNASVLPDEATQTKREGMDANRDEGAKTSHDVHKGTAISWNTYHSYKSACKPLAVYARQEYNMRDISKLTPAVVREYLNVAIECEPKFSTFDKNCSAIEKFCECINSITGGSQDFYGVIDEMRQFAKTELPAPDLLPRAYDDPSSIIASLPSAEQITAGLQLYCGLRVSDACYIKPEQWDGVHLTVHSKNGQYITVTPPPALAGRINAVIASEGCFSVSRNRYDYMLEKACNATGQAFNGTHGLRHNFAQAKMAEYTGQGMTYHQALQKVSEDMGHHRPDITKVYLR